LKTAGAKTQEQARLQVEEAEDKLVQMTETAIGLMKAVLENVSPAYRGKRGKGTMLMCVMCGVAGTAAEPFVVGQGAVDLLQHRRGDPFREFKLLFHNSIC
jgi:hypothetical protein